MSEKYLYQFYLDLIPNLLTELFFFIPEKEIRPDIIEKIDFLKDHDVLNKVYVLDHYQGPIEYKKGRNNMNIFLKGAKLEKNTFSLLEKKSDSKTHEFDYVLGKYFELVECMFYITDWMDSNITEYVKTNNTVIGLFHLQFLDYKKHFETLVKQFYPNKETIPQGNFNAPKLVETYFPDISKSLKTNNGMLFTVLGGEKQKPDLSASNSEITPHHHKMPKNIVKKLLVTEAEAEQILLRTFFNIKINE